jgi:hypothetical protein
VSGVTVAYGTNTNTLVFVGGTNATIPVSVFGNWASVSSVTSSIYSASTLVTPYGTESTNFRNWQMSQLVEMFNQWVTNKFSNNAPAFVDFITTKTNAQSATNKSFYLGSGNFSYLKGAITNGSVGISGTNSADNAVFNADGERYQFSSAPIYINSNTIARLADLTNGGFQFSPHFKTNAATTPRTISLADVFEFSGTSFTFSSDVFFDNGFMTEGFLSLDETEFYTTYSLAEGKDSSTVLRPMDFSSTFFDWDGTNIYIPNGVTFPSPVLSAAQLTGHTTHSGTNTGGRFKNADVEAKTLIATNADIHNLRATNNALSGGTAEKITHTLTRFDGFNTNSGALIHQSVTISTLASGANLLTRPTNNLVRISSVNLGIVISAITNYAGPLADDWFDVINEGTYSVDIAHEANTTTAPEDCRIKTTDGATLTMPVNGRVHFEREGGTVNRWRVWPIGSLSATATNVVLLDASPTNSARISLLSTNNASGLPQVKTISAGFGVVLTNRTGGTNVDVAVDSAVFSSPVDRQYGSPTLTNLSATGAFTNQFAGGWRTAFFTNNGSVTVEETNRVTSIASNATTAQIDFTTTAQYEITNLNTAITLQLTNLVQGRDVWVYVRTDGTARNITVATNGLTTMTRITWGFNALTNGATSFTATNRARINLTCTPVGEVSASYEFQR